MMDLPPPIQSDLAADPAWLEACEKLGFNPLGFQHDIPAWIPSREAQQDIEEEQAAAAWEQEVRRQEYEKALGWLCKIVEYAPSRVRDVLGIQGQDEECKEYCCRDFPIP